MTRSLGQPPRLRLSTSEPPDISSAVPSAVPGPTLSSAVPGPTLWRFCAGTMPVRWALRAQEWSLRFELQWLTQSAKLSALAPKVKPNPELRRRPSRFPFPSDVKPQGSSASETEIRLPASCSALRRDTTP